MHCSIILKPKTIFNSVFSVWLTSLFSLHLPLLYLSAWWLYCHGWWISINNKIDGDFFMGFSWWLLAGVVVGLLGGGWVFFWWVVHGWLMVVRGFAWLFMGSWVYSWLMVVPGVVVGLLGWCYSWWVFLVPWLGFFDRCWWVCWVDGFGLVMDLICDCWWVDRFGIGDGLMVVRRGGGSKWWFGFLFIFGFWDILFYYVDILF